MTRSATPRPPAAARSRSTRSGRAARGQRSTPQGMADLVPTHREPAGAACWPRWSTSASASTSANCEALNERLAAEVRARSVPSSQVRRSRTFNVNSPPQLREILFDEARASTPVKKTKTGFSTDAASLEKLRDQWPEFIDPLLQYREVEKLRRTYGDGPAGRGGARRSHPRDLQPDRRPHRSALSRPAEPAQHPGAQRGGPAVPQGVRPRAGLRAARRRLQPDRAALHRPPRRGPRA